MTAQHTMAFAPRRSWWQLTHNSRVGLRERGQFRALRVGVAIGLVIVAVLTLYAILRLSGVGAWAADSFSSVHLQWLLVALVLQSASMATFARLQRQVLADAGLRVPQTTALAVVYAGNALSVTIPFAGSTAGTAFTYRQYVRNGATGPMASWAMVVAGVFSTVTFGVLVGVGAIASDNTMAAVAGAFSVAVATVPVIGMLIAVRRPAARVHLERITVWVLSRIKRILRRPKMDPGELVRGTVDQISAYRMNWQHCVASGTYAALNWLLDALCLWTVLQAFDVSMPFRNLPLLYAAVVAAASIGITPAGIGTVEAAIALALTDLDGGGAHTLVAAVVYRAISTWLVLMIGWVVLASIRRRSPDSARTPRSSWSSSTV